LIDRQKAADKIEGQIPIPTHQSMAIIKCKECGSKVSSKAANCPSCGVKVKKQTGCGTMIVSLFLVLVVFAYGATLLSSVSSSSNSTAEKSSATTSKKVVSSSGNSTTEKSSSEFKKAAEQGQADAQFDLYERYSLGNGVPMDKSEAVKWCRKAAEQGHVRAQYALGSAYSIGKEVPMDKSEAVKWWRKAAEQGDAAGQRTLGFSYRDGNGVPMDKSEAVKWWRKAAEQGDPDGQFHIGLSYKNGDGIAKDNVEAYKWIYLVHLSSPQGMGDWSIPELEDLSKVMSASQIEDAKQRCKVWRDKHPQAPTVSSPQGKTSEQKPASAKVSPTPPKEVSGQQPPMPPFKPFDVLSLSNAELPKTTKLNIDVRFAIAGGSGTATAAVGSQVKVLSRRGQLIEVGYLDGKQSIPYTQTTVEADVLRMREYLRLREVERLAREEKARIDRDQAEKQEQILRIQVKAKRDQAISSQFSAWDGSHNKFEKYIKDHLNDPSSYKHVETTYNDKGEYLVVITKYRGKNAFGAVITETMMAKVDLSGNLLEIIR